MLSLRLKFDHFYKEIFEKLSLENRVFPNFAARNNVFWLNIHNFCNFFQ